ncbi:hypothetical protein GCM10022224_082530 [Nonomuraea antimicrobica]|uniref:Uncharacterized protein n=1 Tax=Nonomuraea antimicrobica TaxID=561173 RepID=A0ABP7DHM4_9ACTN
MVSLQVRPHGRHVKRPRHAERAWERSAPLGELQTAQGRMQRCTAAREPSSQVGDHLTLDPHQAEQL